jgi:L-asparaginase
LRASFFVGFYPLKNRIKIKTTKMFELPRYPFPAGTGFAEYLFTVTDFSDSPFIWITKKRVYKERKLLGMKSVLVVFTGGTIGSKAEGKSINVEGAGSYYLLQAYSESGDARDDVSLETLQPLNLLSENLTPADWLTLASAIRQTDLKPYSGVIITHGSDTFAYTASLFSYLFSDTGIPIVFTAGNYPIGDERSNGLRNLSGAIDFIADADIPGVFAVYENDRSEVQVFLGTRIGQNESFTDQFRAPYDLVYGEVGDRKFKWNNHWRNPSPELLRSRVDSNAWNQATGNLHTPSSFHTLLEDGNRLKLEDAVIYIKPYPGLRYDLYQWAERGYKPAAILHDLHHSGTACALEEGPYSLPAFIRRCREQQIDVYLCPIKDAGDTLYASSHKLTEAGGIWVENMSIEATLTKMMLAYGAYGSSQNREEAKALVLNEILFYEKLPLQE